MKEMVTVLEHDYIFTEDEIDSIKNIFSMEDPAFIVNSLLAYKYLEYLLKNSSNPELYECLSETDRRNFLKILLLTMRYIYQYDLDQHLNTFEFEYTKERQVNHQLNYLYNITGIIHNWTYKSKLFAVEFLSITDGLVILFELLNNKLLISKIMDLENSVNKSAANYISKSIYRNVLVSIYNLSYLEYLYQEDWKAVHAFYSLMNVARFSAYYRNLANFLFVAYLSVANIFHDIDVSGDKLSEIKLVIKTLIEMFNRCINKMGDKKFLLKMNVYEASDKIYDITFIEEFETKWNFIEITGALTRLSVNDTLKNVIYSDYPILENAQEAIKKGNEVEQDFAIKLLWHLCFNKKISQDVLSNYNELLMFIRQIFVEKREYVENKRLLVTISNFMFYLRKEIRSDPEETKTNAAVNLNHITISYQNDEKEFCLRLKSDLETQNFRVSTLMDKNVYSSLESVIKSLENSQFLLCLMSERYKQDACCRAEAEHAYKLDKNIIPIIAVKGYKPSGWLQNIIISKLTIDAPNMHQDECIKRIIREISLITARNRDQMDERPPRTQVANRNQVLITANNNNERLTSISQIHTDMVESQKTIRKLNWTEQDVRLWIIEKEFNQLIVETIMPCDGSVLEQYYTMLINVPEFFFSSLSVKVNVSLRDSGYFASELKKLFE
jgi:hypothetical protein